MKTKEELIEDYIDYLYQEDKDEPMYVPEVTQSRLDFSRGFEVAKEIYSPKWIKGTPPHSNDVLVKEQRKHTKTTVVSFASYVDGEWLDDEMDNVENIDWSVIGYMEIPQ